MTLAKTLYRVPRQEGLHVLQQRGQVAEELTSYRLRLSPGQSATYESGDDEAILILQDGRGALEYGVERVGVARDGGVFRGPATALYLPPGHSVTATGGDGERVFEAILVATPAPSGGEPLLIRPEDVEILERGRGDYTRTIHNLLVSDTHARRLLVGETFNHPGKWSSFPPHKHDGRDGEPRLEEVYHYRVDPPTGFGQQLLYTADGESVSHTVRDGDAVVLPYGYHPVAAPPGHRVYYLWALSGEERRLVVYEDPAFRWLHDVTDG